MTERRKRRALPRNVASPPAVGSGTARPGENVEEPLIFELSSPGRVGCSLPQPDVPLAPLPQERVRQNLELPELSERDVVRHYTRLSQLNFAVDTPFILWDRAR